MSRTSWYSWRRSSVFRLDDGRAGQRRPASAGPLQDVLHLARGRGRPSPRASSSGDISQRTSGNVSRRCCGELRPGREVGPGHRDDLGPRRARVDLVRDLARGGSDQDHQGPAGRHLGVACPAGERRDALPLRGGARARRGERVGVLDDDPDGGRRRPVPREQSVQEREGACGVGGKRRLPREHTAELLLARGVGEGEPLRDVEGDDDTSGGREGAAALRPAERSRARRGGGRARCRGAGRSGWHPTDSGRGRPS